MAVTTSVLKLGRLDATVKFNGTATTTFALSSLVKDETLGTAKANIHALKWSNAAATPITVSRNSVIQYQLSGTGEMILDGYDDSTSNTFDLAIDLGTGASTLILELRKVGGFVVPNDQNQG